MSRRGRGCFSRGLQEYQTETILDVKESKRIEAYLCGLPWRQPPIVWLPGGTGTTNVQRGAPSCATDEQGTPPAETPSICPPAPLARGARERAAQCDDVRAAILVSSVSVPSGVVNRVFCGAECCSYRTFRKCSKMVISIDFRIKQ